MKNCTFPDGSMVPALGQGTWKMGGSKAVRQREADALRVGLDLGMTLIDTAEMYGDAELVVADAIRGRREDVYLVSKVLPGNASLEGTIRACENSLRRMDTDYIDLYLLHWPGSYPLSETLEAFRQLKLSGKIRSYGVSNFDVAEMEGAWNENGGKGIATNQVLYNLKERGIEWSLLPWCRERHIPVMAYSPVNQGSLPGGEIETIAARHGVTSFQVALSWLLNQDNVIVIPKSSNPVHVEQNHAASSLFLDAEDLRLLEAAFPAPAAATPLAIL